MERQTATEWSGSIDGSRVVGGEAEQSSRAFAIKKAVKVWSGQLVDLSGRNNLLYFKDLKRGTLDLGDARPERVDDLLAGRVVALSRLFADDEARAVAAKRARTIRNKAQEHFEERGLQTLYIACGMASWTSSSSSAKPAAPVLLCPVRLAPRGAAQEDFELALTGELEVNPTLLQLLSTEFNCDCDPAELLERVDIEGAIDTPKELIAVYDWLTERAHSVPGFSVAARFVLGTFSYAKLPMVNDLEQAVDAMVAHELIAAIAGDADARGRLRETQSSAEVPDPNHIPLADEFLILDADESQNYAINSVVHGQNLIVKGPPGTGKSQTIANLISTLLARGEKVLFVAEKRAAIDAVLKRLAERELDDVVLDLHSASGTRRKTAQALARALHTNRTIPRPNHEPRQQRVEARRAELNARVEALRAPREPWGLSTHEVHMRLAGFSAATQSAIRLEGATLQAMGGVEFSRAKETLRDFVWRGGLELASSDSPWAHASVSTAEQATAALSLVRRLLQHTLPGATEQLEAAARETGIESPVTLDAWSQRIELWEHALEISQIFSEAIYDERVPAWLHATQPMEASVLARAGKTVASGEFRRSRRQLRACMREGVRLTQPELHQQAATALEGLAHWTPIRADDGTPRAPSDLETTAASWKQLVTELAELQEHLASGDLLQLSQDDLEKLLSNLLRDQALLFKLPELIRLRASLLAAGLGPFLHDMGARKMAPDTSLRCLEYVWLSSILEAITATDPRIGAFDGALHRNTVQDFREGDAEHIASTATRVRRVCAERATAAQNDFPDETALVEHQAGLKRRHLALRQLFSAAPNVLTALKPCWAMSPLMVSQVLPAEKPYFDVVIFDEASQVTPADAVPALIRGKRVVVAGDDRQLPPTAFFAAGANDAEDATADEELSISIMSGFESILDALGAFVPFRMLRWHYRSRDERLIAFSNLHFYDRSLITFPGITGEECVKHFLIPFQAGLVGQEQSVSAEVDKVVELILDHAQRRPHESLGVIAMGIKHAQRVDEELRRRLSDHPELDSFFDEDKNERFFVKNLERVQGDERDAIILTIGYGKDENGRLLYRFGPLNQEGGERRLNVAVTRAKQRMTLVSSFGSADMDPNRSSAEGVKLLRAYLQYAEQRGSTLGDAIDTKPELNPFEIDVRDSLVRAGVPVVPQYGCSGYRIDFVAAHPEKPGRMVLAIECDGATYHSSDSARDRDRLRQDQLERLGWTFHRIWSQDWFNNKEIELKHVVEAYRASVVSADDADRQPEGAREANRREPAATIGDRPPAERAARPYLPYWSSIDQYTQGELRELIRWIKSDTLLRTDHQLLREAMRELGFARKGKKITAAIEQAIAAERLAQT